MTAATPHPPIVVLFGGPSAEHDVSIVSGTAIADALRGRGDAATRRSIAAPAVSGASAPSAAGSS